MGEELQQAGCSALALPRKMEATLPSLSWGAPSPGHVRTLAWARTPRRLGSPLFLVTKRVMVRSLLFLSVFFLGGCATLETRLREERADRESIEEAFLSPEPRIRALAAESCVWSRTQGCAERLQVMAQSDDAQEVRDAAVRTLGALCDDEARRRLVELVGTIEARGAFSDANARCPIADLRLALEGEGFERSLPDTLQGRQRHLDWLEELVTLSAPRRDVILARDRVAAALQQEHAEGARAEEIERAVAVGWRAVESGKISDANEIITQLIGLGAPAGALLRRVSSMSLARARSSLLDALERADPDEAERLLEEVPLLSWKDPTLAERIENSRYQLLLPEVLAVEKLAASGRVDEAGDRWWELSELGAEPILIDRAKAARHRAERLVERGRFDEAWRASWILRFGESPAAEKFIASYSEERWRREGIELSSAELRGFIDEVGAHAPRAAQERLELLTWLDRLGSGDAFAAVNAAGRLASDLRGALRRCEQADPALPAPADQFNLQEMPGALEYLAERVTTHAERTRLRRVRDEARELIRAVSSQRDKLHEVVRTAERCQEISRDLEFYRGARPGSEAFEKARAASMKAHACLIELLERVDLFQRQAEACGLMLRKASDEIQGYMKP